MFGAGGRRRGPAAISAPGGDAPEPGPRPPRSATKPARKQRDCGLLKRLNGGVQAVVSSPRKVVTVPSLAQFKTHLDNAVRHMV